MGLKLKKEIVASVKDRRGYYVKGVNMSCSFAGLEAIAKSKSLRLADGDVLIVDNARGDKRKCYVKNANGSCIVYAMARKGNEFLARDAAYFNYANPLIEFFAE